jgi:hypothetical protein
MRRSLGAAALAALVVLLLFPALALARGAQPSYEGTYAGVGNGVSDKGRKGGSTLTIWVQDLGATTRFTIRVDKIGLTIAADGPETWVDDATVSVALDVDTTSLKAKGTVILYHEGDAWTLDASGAGKVGSYAGRGTAVAVRTATGVELPSLAQQAKDMMNAAFGGPPDSVNDPKTAAAFHLSGLPATGPLKGVTPKPVPVATVAEASVLAPATPTPPIPDSVALECLAVLLFLLAVALAFGLAKPQEFRDALAGIDPQEAADEAMDQQLHSDGTADDQQGGPGASPPDPSATREGG